MINMGTHSNRRQEQGGPRDRERRGPDPLPSEQRCRTPGHGPRLGLWPLEVMISKIVRDNKIEHLNLVVYEPITNFANYPDLDPESGLQAKMDVHVNYLSDELERAAKVAGRKDDLVGITSEATVRGDSSPRHLFFIDFSSLGCRPSDENLRRIVDFVEKLKLMPGFILDSGNSYHYYCNGLFDPKTWQEKLELIQGLDYDELVDQEWVKLQIRRGYSVLRISTNDEKPEMPRIVGVVGYGQPVSPDIEDLRIQF